MADGSSVLSMAGGCFRGICWSLAVGLAAQPSRDRQSTAVLLWRLLPSLEVCRHNVCDDGAYVAAHADRQGIAVADVEPGGVWYLHACCVRRGCARHTDRADRPVVLPAPDRAGGPR